MVEKGEMREEEEDRNITSLLFEIMENYSDSVIPSLSQFSPIRKIAIGDEKGCSSSRKRDRKPEEEPKEGNNNNNKNTIADLQKERQRRGKMREMYSVLRELVPTIFPKDPKSKILGDTVKFIRHLEKEIERLENLKSLSESEMAARGGGGGGRISKCTNWKSSVSVTISGRLVFFAIESLARRSLAVEILMVFDKYGVDVLAANVTVVDENQLMVSVTALVDCDDHGDGVVEQIKTEIMILWN